MAAPSIGVPVGHGLSPLRQATSTLNAIAMWDDSAQDEANMPLGASWDAMQPFLRPGSVYVDVLAAWVMPVDRAGEGRLRTQLQPPGAYQSDVRSAEFVPPESQHQTRLTIVCGRGAVYI